MFAVFIQRLNKVSHWVSSLVLLCETEFLRAQMKRHFLSVAKCLKEMKNFLSFVAVVAGLSGTPVTRLKKTEGAFVKQWPTGLQELDDFVKLIDPTPGPSGGFAALRVVMAKAGSQILPYPGMTAQELILNDVEEGVLAVNGKPLLNFSKTQTTSKIIDLFQQFQKFGEFGSIQQLEPLYSHLTALPFLGTNEQYGLSLLREPKSS